MQDDTILLLCGLRWAGGEGCSDRVIHVSKIRVSAIYVM